MLPEKIALLSISILIVIIGFLLNGFIVTVNLFKCIKFQTLETINVLITGLGLVRFILLSIHMKHICFLMFGWSLFQIDEYLGTLIVCVIFCSFWWGSVLCVFYCVKISNYSNRLFMRLKMNISKMVTWLLLISLVISFLFSLPYSWSVTCIHVVNGTNNGNKVKKVNIVRLFIIIFAGSIIPFMVFCVSVYLIIVSLLRHTTKMSSRDSGFSIAQRDIHLCVIWNMISFLLFYALYFASFVLVILTMNFENPIFTLVCYIFIAAYPSLHSISLIFSNRELKRAFFIVFSFNWLGNIRQETS
ncbi:taste receptor type 2 member 39-like [Bufo bufo]|uniref:taste receptor type 2 member 39-like n=1 Tax=Bufo bufo TaxID=8384 RepID=UPI001ABDBA7F|nr:taste receptor type 2 member 39-like [Bufo bufo]